MYLTRLGTYVQHRPTSISFPLPFSFPLSYLLKLLYASYQYILYYYVMYV